MGKKGDRLGNRIGKRMANSGGPYNNPNIVRLGYIPKEVYLRFIKLARPDETMSMLMSRLANEHKVRLESPKEICGIKLRKRNSRRHN